METLSFEQMEVIEGGKSCLSEGLYLASASAALAAAITTGGLALIIAVPAMMAAESAFYDCYNA